ncbi:snoRNA-binding rRNA-processing protein imp4 [Friedmanniomyces endolithicus]|uniref:U3 small nucleolar ribonucleoprotein protein IMP4 n=1 Tax=Friedmanniomyces endolithicus TaxID=329885 RepID=A0AAN6KCG0_9PEZI|nr:snoRNA-binding rRNA-processing protein imp4 [Friedmanniomyces endolithicus]KAK0782059.1 snoRNA-binding rRNA-processing protein imp4 [Friedmanniomyces endolithicus]KAK0789942.1 snoRNA-binding rRNA-processing protein imp4 [Friedmanniomyces endolithicus]KAK0796149.1 snoRNA-binding rRNA-processing protein imp4 [Friedmanniomyces endolithicus]KAK0855650.1 snoRNA-binding rRNA-processing protein imp4 [Friedmanniomyces endolithicus]
MLRRQARERRDYLYRRALTLRDAEIAEKRSKLKASLATGKPLDPTIANDKQLRQDYKYDESRADRTAEEELLLDDEYSHLSGVVDPRVLVTTSRDPSSRLSSFAKEIRLLLPTAIRLNRGNLVLPNLVGSAKSSGLSDLILLHEHRGTPTALTISHFPHGPTASFSLHNVILRHDIPNASRGTVSESYPHLIFEGFTTRLGKRTVKILQHLFPPRESGSAAKLGSRVVTFKNIEDSIEVRHHVFVKTGYRSVELAEVGPRMTMRLFEIRQGTADNKEGDVEWHMNQYTRTSKKKDYLMEMSPSNPVQAPTTNCQNRLMALPPELRKLIYELVLADEDEIIEIYPEDTYDDEDPCLWQPVITRVSRELRHETLGMFFGRMTFHVPLESTCHRDGMDYNPDDDGSGYCSEDDFLMLHFESFCEFRKHVEKWFRTNAEHLKFMKTLTLGICAMHATIIKLAVSGGAVQSTLTIAPEGASPGTCWAQEDPIKYEIAGRVECVLGTGTARQPHLTLDVCNGLLDVMAKYGRNFECELCEDEDGGLDEDKDKDEDEDEDEAEGEDEDADED